MRHLARELLATDGVLGFYNSAHGPHKYPRIQIKMTAGRVIEQLVRFLRDELGVACRYRTETAILNGSGISRKHVLQISRSEDVDVWRREIGFSNPSHISRMMVYELLGECKPGSSIIDRLSLLCGRQSSPWPSVPIAPSDFLWIIDQMTNRFGFPIVKGNVILQRICEINKRLGLSVGQTLGRKLPSLVEL